MFPSSTVISHYLNNNLVRAVKTWPVPFLWLNREITLSKNVRERGLLILKSCVPMRFFDEGRARQGDGQEENEEKIK